MASRTYTVHEAGMHGLTVTIECHSSNGLPGIVIVGLASKAIDESKERLRSAFSSSGLNFPRKRLTLNLAPADEPKEGASLDLGLAVSILLAHHSNPVVRDVRSVAFFGELGLDGTIRPVRGIIGKVLAAKKAGFKTAIVPTLNIDQASLVSGITILEVDSLISINNWLFDRGTLRASLPGEIPRPETTYSNDLSEVVGHLLAKRSLEIAAAGGHNVLLNGPPGTGKSMLAKTVPGILPSLTKDQIIETSHLHSLVGHLESTIQVTAPFRAPHHSASSVSIIGGGQSARPGEISLAHNGVLFLDELPEYRRDCLEALRQPLEDHTVNVARAKQSITYPADFMLIATKNPCPCGHYGTARTCVCGAHEIARYNKKVSGPILDRIDIHTEVEEIPYHLLGDTTHIEESSASIRQRVQKARDIQKTRNPKGVLNTHLSNRQLNNSTMVEPSASDLLATAGEKMGISTRGLVRTLRVARTIADLDGSQKIQKQHVAEALQFRPKALHLL